MPTYYAGCGCTADYDYPEDEDEEVSGYCDSCSDSDDYDDDDRDENSYADGIAAQRVARDVNAMADNEFPDMRVPNSDRAVSCEFEGTYGIRTGVMALDYVQYGARYEHHGDSTCDGEIVFSRLHLLDRSEAIAYARSATALAMLHADRALKVGMRAGHHVHVSALDGSGRKMTPADLVSLYSIYMHCEDVLYRLAAAGWRSHRSDVDSSYSGSMHRVPGGLPKTPKNVGNAIGGARYQGVNISPYVAHMRSCRCGAFQYGAWNECECGDNNATIEWRLWNAAVSPRKIRAYIAISAVLTDAAATTDASEVEHLAENPYRGCETVDESSLDEQLTYLLTRPGFNERDRDDIRWLASFSPGMGELAHDYRTARQFTTTAAPDVAYA